MNTGQLIMYIIQTVTTIVIALIGWGIKTAISSMKEQITKNASDISKVQKELTDLKADLPFVYTTREDFIRSLNNVDKQMNDMNGKLDRLLSK